MEVNPETFRRLVSGATFAFNGDGFEQRFGQWITRHFPNCERFWCLFVVPLTKRIEDYPYGLNPKPPNIGMHHRDDMNSELKDIAATHYSMFLHLLYTYDNLRNRNLSWITDCYLHIASACDLAEAFLEKWYLLKLRLQGAESKVIKYLSEEEFLEIAQEWYVHGYPDIYEHYLSKGKYIPIKLPTRKHVLKEYLGSDWTGYDNSVRPLRTFRNRVVHNVEIGKVILPYKSNGQTRLVHFIPKPEKVGDYETWDKIEQAIQNREVFERDFAPATQQILEDIQVVQEILNKIWKKFVIPEFEHEFYERENSPLREIYDIQFGASTWRLTYEGILPTHSVDTEVQHTGTYNGGSVEFLPPGSGISTVRDRLPNIPPSDLDDFEGFVVFGPDDDLGDDEE